MSDKHKLTLETQVMQARAVKALKAENARLRAAIEWALGMRGPFRDRDEGEGAYYWRTELRQKAGMNK